MTTPESFIEEMQHFSKLNDQERNALRELRPLLTEYADSLTAAFYDNLLAYEGTAKHFEGHPELIPSLKNHLKKWFIGLANGSYEEQYAQERYRIGYRHVEISLEMRYMVAAMSFCRDFIMPQIQERLGDTPEASLSILALNKVMDLDLNLMLKTYVERNQEVMAETEQRSLQKFLSVTNMNAELYQALLRASDND